MFFKCAKQPNLKKIIITALAVLFLDQAIKFIALNNAFFAVDIYRNYNALFGLPVNFSLIFILFAFLIFVYAISFRKTEFFTSNVTSLITTGLIFGGIVSNSIDRFFYGYVIDYLNFLDLFVFNIADLAIFFGALLFGWKIFRE